MFAVIGCILVIGTRGVDDQAPTRWDEYRALATQISEDYYDPRRDKISRIDGLEQRQPISSVEHSIGELAKLTQSKDLEIRKSATKGLRVTVKGDAVDQALEGRGLTIENIQKQLDDFRGIVLDNAQSAIDRSNSADDRRRRGEPEVSLDELAEDMKETAESVKSLLSRVRTDGQAEALKYQNYYEQQEGRRKVWEGGLLKIAEAESGPPRDKSPIKLSRGMRPYAGSVMTEALFITAAGPTVSDLTLDLRIVSSRKDADHRVFFFPKLDGRSKYWLGLSIADFAPGMPGFESDVVTVVYTVYSKEFTVRDTGVLLFAPQRGRRPRAPRDASTEQIQDILKNFRTSGDRENRPFIPRS